jgi:hypothetical protein
VTNLCAKGHLQHPQAEREKEKQSLLRDGKNPYEAWQVGDDSPNWVMFKWSISDLCRSRDSMGFRYPLEI